MYPAIVVIAYNRPSALRRLLRSISQAQYACDLDVPLVISIDRSDCSEVYSIAHGFEWPYGEKLIVEHEKHLGLRQHILVCGDLVNRYDSIIMLEDDLVVSPWFYRFSLEALKFYANDDTIAGVSLYSSRYNETTYGPFEAVDDGFDSYFMQLPSSWGQVLTKKQWKGFRSWYDSEDCYISTEDLLPANIFTWPESSWKKYFAKYLISSNTFFVYPRSSLSTNCGDIGVHHTEGTRKLQVPLLLAERQYRFSKFRESRSVYDAHMEILGEKLKSFNEKLKAYDFEVDLHAKKDISKIDKEYVLTSVRPSAFELSFSSGYVPSELGVLLDIQGEGLYLARKLNLEKRPLSGSRHPGRTPGSLPLSSISPPKKGA